jgi:glycosyltransferase involved in cell wall biosynthesis
MKISIDTSPLKSGHQFRGIGIYTKRLIEALKKVDKKNEYLFINHQSSIISHQIDLVHYPYFDLFFLTLPLKKPWPTVVTIHDVIPLVFPKKYPKGIKGWIKFQVQKFSLKSAQAVITDSENSKKDIVRYLGYPKDKIYVIPLAPGEEFKKLVINHPPAGEAGWSLVIKQKYQLPDAFVLYVGDVNWNKNVPGLIRAFKKIKKSGFQLVLIGKAFEDESLSETKKIIRLIEQLNLSNRTKILGFVPDEDLVAIYNLATCYCQPSFYEGFCLPVLEAMACGTPVVCGKTSSLPEVVGEAGVFVNPEDDNDIAKGLKKVLENKAIYNRLRKKGFKRVKQYSWPKTARETINVYQKVLAR